jgi:hypothetical protein
MPSDRLHQDHTVHPNSDMSFRLATAGMHRPALDERSVTLEETAVTSEATSANSSGEGVLSTTFSGEITDTSTPVPAVEVPIYDKRYIHNAKHRIRLVRWFIMAFRAVRFVFAWWKKYNSEEEKFRRMEVKKIEADIRDGEKRLKSTAMGLGFKALQKIGKYEQYVTIWFDVMAWQKPHGERLFYHVASPLPNGVWGADLVKREVLNEFQRSMQHPMNGYDSPDTGTLLIVERAGLGGLPKFVALGSMLDEMPKNAPPLTIAMGMASNGRGIFTDLADGPHAIVAGGSRKGKSNEINAMIVTWSIRNKPETVQIVLFDLKEGVEFGRFNGLDILMDKETLGGSAIVETIEDALPRLSALKVEMKRRFKLLKECRVTNIGEYNLRHRGKNKLPFNVLIFDEYAVARLDKRYGNDIENELIEIANKGACAGMHIIIGTQYPKSEILSGILAINFQLRLAFSMTPSASQVVLGNWNAANLGVKGRMVAQINGDEIILQGPRVVNSTIDSVVKASETGESVQEMARLDAEEICLYGLDNLGGALTFDSLFSKFRESGITQSGLKHMIKTMHNQTYVLRETAYVVVPGSGTSSCHLEPVQE